MAGPKTGAGQVCIVGASVVLGLLSILLAPRDSSPPGDAALGNDPLTSGLATIRPGCGGRERHIYVLSVAQAVPALDCLEG
jgi:hypothetical protein